MLFSAAGIRYLLFLPWSRSCYKSRISNQYHQR